MKIDAFGLTDVGKKRIKNEDNFLINEKLRLYVIADGMGGHSGGEFASKLAVATIEEVISGINSDPEATVISGVNTDEADFGDRLRYAIEIASSKIYDKALFDSALKGMGTTTVAVLFHAGQVFIANVGDSRGYLFHANKMKQITTDHSLVSEQLQAGFISSGEVKGHKLKNIITRSVGYQEDVEIDIKKIEVHMGDKILLCTDGLSNMLDDEEICRIVVENPIKTACEKLIEQGNEAGGEDNITALLMEVIDPKGD
ncbi:MAG: Stp1/IreP family PP2C-type Ser/Thr phosphatase [Deltaproteobacteria bacterium]|nr:Stp1/IreP family PP2C-type Ser/Thr phosphatase [Deltaproteobacteria bacterium]